MFSVRVLHDDRIVLVAEQRPDASEEDSFQWMSRVLQVGVQAHSFCLSVAVLIQGFFKFIDLSPTLNDSNRIPPSP